MFLKLNQPAPTVTTEPVAEVKEPAPAPAEPKAEESAPVEQQASGEKPSADDILNMIRNRS
jgi:hypothetical protein